MEYLVTMTTHVPDATPDDAVDDVRVREAARSRELAAQAREAERAQELAGQGHLRRLWTLPGQGRALGLWQAGGPAEMQAMLRSLPLDAWMTVQTTPLSPHPSDPAQTS
jgi:muconolactone D-isomerase